MREQERTPTSPWRWKEEQMLPFILFSDVSLSHSSHASTFIKHNTQLHESPNISNSSYCIFTQCN